MKMAEGAKLQMCYLLHHLCDIQLRHRVESIISFSFQFVQDIQVVRKKNIVAMKIVRVMFSLQKTARSWVNVLIATRANVICYFYYNNIKINRVLQSNIQT